MRVQEISGKDVHNMKARSLSDLAASSKRGPNFSRSGQANPGFEGGAGVQQVQGCLKGV